MFREEQAKKVQKVIAKAWADEAFKQRLLSKPMETLEEEGIAVPADTEIRVVESTPKLYYFVVPPKPEDMAHIEDLEQKLAVYTSVVSACN